MTSKLNLIKIRLINFDFGKRLKILRVFADGMMEHLVTTYSTRLNRVVD